MTTWLSVSVDNIVILILLLALAVKYIFFEEKNDIRRLRFKEEEKATRRTEEKVETYTGADNNTGAMNMSLRQRFGTKPVFGWYDSEDGIEKEVQTEDKEVQTDATFHSGLTDSDGSVNETSKKDEPRSLEDCLEIYKSEVGNIPTAKLFN